MAGLLISNFAHEGHQSSVSQLSQVVSCHADSAQIYLLKYLWVRYLLLLLLIYYELYSNEFVQALSYFIGKSLFLALAMVDFTPLVCT